MSVPTGRVTDVVPSRSAIRLPSRVFATVRIICSAGIPPKLLISIKTSGWCGLRDLIYLTYANIRTIDGAKDLRELQSLAQCLEQLGENGVRHAFAVFNNCYQNFGVMNAATMAEILRDSEER